jgi:D-alanyl-lipoteichoic acid acyltransferase DltB (MBOAT superfamily)
MAEKIGEFSPMFVAFVIFPILASLILRLPQRYLYPALSLAGIAASYVCGILTTFRQFQHILRPSRFAETLVTSNLLFAGYLAIAILSYRALRRVELAPETNHRLAYLMPLSSLLLFRLVLPRFGHIDHDGLVMVALGVSYVSFKLCYLVSEVQNGVVPMPTLSQYLSFAFFPPLIFVGPIQHYSSFHASTSSRSAPSDPARALMRILVGIVKFTYLSAVFGEFGYGLAFLGDGHYHPAIDLVLAILLYPVYLYCNFSGLCDIAIGVSGLMGISVLENFDRPFLSRNLQEFWTKWHISLSLWMRIMVFTPIVKLLSRRTTPANTPHVIALGVMISFILIGLWHGLSSHYLLFGLSQGIGVAFVHYANLWMRRKLTKEQNLKYRASKGIHWAGVCATYCYFALSLFLFANTLEEAHSILAHIG